MGLFEQIQRDIKSIVTNLNDFGVPIILTAPTIPITTVTVAGTIKKHHLTYDEFGNVKASINANVTNATCSVSALTLNAENYPYRNAENLVTFKGHKATWTDVSGLPITYAVNQWFPDAQTGMIVLILGDLE